MREQDAKRAPGAVADRRAEDGEGLGSRRPGGRAPTSGRRRGVLQARRAARSRHRA